MLKALLNYSIYSLLVLSIPILIGLFTNYKLNRKSVIFYGLLISISISLLAYFTDPPIEDDLARYYNEIDNMRIRGIYFVINQGTWQGTIISNLILYIISLTEDNHLLPFFIIFIEMICVFYIIQSEKNRVGLSTKNMMWYLFIYFGICDIFVSISGIRFMFGLTIAAVILYDDLICSKYKIGFKKYIYYLVLPLIHSSLIIILLLRILTLVKHHVKIFYAAILVWPVLLQPISLLFKTIPIPLLQNISGKMISYRNYSDISQSPIRTVGFLIFSLCFLIMLLESISNYPQEDYLKFITFLFLFSISGLYSIVSIYFRFTSLQVILLPPLINKAFKNKKIESILKLSLFGSLQIFYIYQYILYFSRWKFII